MKVKGHVRAVYFIAAFVGTCEVFLYLNCESSILLAVFHLVLLKVSLLQRLFKVSFTSSFSTSVCSCDVLSDKSLIKLKLSSFLRYVFQNYSL